MRAILTCCWPGLTRLWYRGEWRGLATALLFAALFNLAILARFVWPELLSAKLANSLWILVGLGLAVGFVRSLSYLSHQVNSSAGGSADEKFKEAQSEYLCGHWFEAEALLREILLQNPRDLESQLLLSGLLRHTGRWDESSGQLDTLERLDGSSKWWLEIQQERSRLRQAREEPAAENLPESDQDLTFSGESWDEAETSELHDDETSELHDETDNEHPETDNTETQDQRREAA